MNAFDSRGSSITANAHAAEAGADDAVASSVKGHITMKTIDRNALPTVDSNDLSSVTGGVTGRWLAHHPFAAAGFLANHPLREARFMANHPVAGARISAIQSRWGI